MKRTTLFAPYLMLIIGCTGVAHASTAADTATSTVTDTGTTAGTAAGTAIITELEKINDLTKQGQYATALERLNSYLSKNPHDAPALFLKGLILSDQNKSADAIKVFTGLTEDFPELPEPYNNLAVLYAAQGHYEQARHSLEMAIHTHPDYAIAEENLGDIYAKMAAIAYAKALQLDNTDTTAQTKLTLAQQIFSVQKPVVPLTTRQQPQDQPLQHH